MKTCTKCGCVYDDSFVACPTCNKTVEKEIVDKIGKGLIGILLIVIFVPMAIASETFAPIIFGLIIYAVVIAANKKSNTNIVKSEIQTNKQTYTPNRHTPSDEISIKKEILEQEISTEPSEKQKVINAKRYENIEKLKKEYIEENFNEETDFENFKYSIYEDGDNYFEHGYQEQCSGEREYFLLNNQWCYFTFDNETFKYTFKIEKNKTFSKNCRVDWTDKKTQQLIKYLLSNPSKKKFYEADLKKQITTGKLIKCEWCGYRYHSDNWECPNCGV